ncbi:MAG: hypothetical protein H6810_11220 [Phycisphaeraceae bacterium]|nr:MAG: hypothetical protein H6810_11220 [Phycisphaeraceae bacterium]
MRIKGSLTLLASLGGVACGQLIVQDQFLLGDDPLAGEYVEGSYLHQQGPTGGSILGFQGAWEAPWDDNADTTGSAYPSAPGLTYQVGPERLDTAGGCFRYIRMRGTGYDYYSWRDAAPGQTRSEWWASVLIETTEQSHHGSVHIDFVEGETLEFGLATHGFPYIAELYGLADQAMTGQAHLLVARVIDDPVDGEWVQLWVDPVPLRATLGGDPPIPPDVEGPPGHDVIVGGTGELLYVNLRTHAFAGYDMYFDEIRVGGSWSDVVPVIVEPGCNGADLADPLGLLDLNDVNAFVVAFLGQHPAADLAEPVGVLDLSDVLAFIDAFLGGCP